LNELISLFANNLLPIFLISGAGFAAGKWLKVNPRSLSRLIFYIFSPCLIFELITTSQLSNNDIVRTMAFAGILILLLGLITWGIGRVVKLEKRLLTGVLITAMFMNAGNYGLPVTLFTFGETALSYASLFFVSNAILVNSVGVVIASSGSMGFKQALKGLLKLPTIYALVFAFIFINRGWELPTPIDRTVTLLSDAAIPGMLVLLGLQLQSMRWTGQVLALSLASTMRLLVSPIIAIGISTVIGMSTVAHQAIVLESAMPAAVIVTVLATEFDVEPSFVTAVVYTTTLISPFTVTPLLAYLGA
jgi:predicted permease